MNATSPEITEFLGVVERVLAQSLTTQRWGIDEEQRRGLERALAEADVLDLAIETADLDDALDWLIATVRTVSAVSPSVGFALATRYAGQRAVRGGHGEAAAVTAGVVAYRDPVGGAEDGTAEVDIILPALFPATRAVLVGVGAGASGSVIEAAPDDPPRPATVTGLRDAQLTVRSVTPAQTAPLTPSLADAVATELALLLGAVALGVAQGLRDAAETYAAERVQFGAPISTFAGVRAILVEMSQGVATVEALVQRAAGSTRLDHALELTDTALDVAVRTGLAAIQVLGGYGYIDEYPVAHLTRDAVSVRARAFSHRAIVAELADRRLGGRGQ